MIRCPTGCLPHLFDSSTMIDVDHVNLMGGRKIGEIPSSGGENMEFCECMYDKEQPNSQHFVEPTLYAHKIPCSLHRKKVFHIFSLTQIRLI